MFVTFLSILNIQTTNHFTKIIQFFQKQVSVYKRMVTVAKKLVSVAN